MASSFVSVVSTLVLGSGTAFAVWTQDPAQATDQPALIINASIDDRLEYNIPAQSLRGALLIYGKLTGLQISADPARVAGIMVPAITGKFTPQQALAKLLSGTKLSPLYVGKTGVIVTTPNRVYAQAGDGTQLDTIVVEGGADKDASSGNGFQGTPDWVYETPDSVSVISREAIQNTPVRNAGDLLDSAAGVYSNKSEAQNPGISVNIRGLQDQDRVATMIDGARQTFQRNGHGATQRVYVDSAFIRQVEVEKSSSSRAGSVGSLGGSVNFRTIKASDLIDADKYFGSEFTVTTGTNAFDFEGSGAATYRIFDNLSILGGLSHKKIGAFEIGQKGELKQNTTYTGDTLLFTGEEVYSSLLKAELKINNYMHLTVGWVRYDSNFNSGNFDNILGGGALKKTVEDVVNNTYTAAFDWNPANELIDFKARVFYNQVDDEKLTNQVGPFVIPGDERKATKYRMGTEGASLENTSKIKIQDETITLNFGAEGFRDKGVSELHDGAYIVFNTEGTALVDYSEFLTGGTPSGERTVAGGFFNAKLEHNDWLTLEGGLRYDWYNISGNTTIFQSGRRVGHPATNCVFEIGGVCYAYGTPAYTEYFPPEAFNIKTDRSGGALLPTLMVAVEPTDFLQLFVKYSKSFRPPTVMESFINGGHANGTVTGYAPNPNLNPEKAATFEIGLNISKNAVFGTEDSLRLKAVGFKRTIDDYISFGTIHNDVTNQNYTSYINLYGPTLMKGIEIEANYDAKYFYIGGAFTYLNTDLADKFVTPGGNLMPINSGVGAAIIFEQPKQRYMVDAGIRLLDEKLTLGMRLTKVGKTDPQQGSLQQNFQLEGYKLIDLYGSYAFSEKTKLSFAVKNLEDIAYAPALGADYFAAPGRTATVSLNLKF